MSLESTSLSQFINIKTNEHWLLNYGIRELITNWNDVLTESYKLSELKYRKTRTKHIKYIVTLDPEDHNIYMYDKLKLA